MLFDKPKLRYGTEAEPPPSTWGEIYQSTNLAMRNIDTFNALSTNLSDQYDLVGDEIFKATGKEYVNPYRTSRGVFDKNVGLSEDYYLDMHKKQVEALRLEAPDAMDWDEILNRPEREVKFRMSEYERRRAEAYAKTSMLNPDDVPLLAGTFVAPVVSGVGSLFTDPVAMSAVLAGSLTGSMTSPLDAAANFAGPATGSVSASLIKNAAKAMFVNMAAQAALEPKIQQNRAFADLPHGWQDAAANILTAGVMGGVLDISFRAPVRTFRRAGSADVRRETGTFFEDAPDTDTPKRKRPVISQETFEKATEGDIKAFREVTEALGIQDDKGIQGLRNYMETGARIDVEAEQALESMGYDLAKGLDEFYAQAKALGDPDQTPIIRGTEPEIVPEIRSSPDEAMALAARDPQAVNDLLDALVIKLREMDAKLPRLLQSAYQAGFGDVLPLLKKNLGKTDPETINTLAADFAKLVEADPTFEDRAALYSGRLSPVEAARILRDRPEVVAKGGLPQYGMDQATALRDLSPAAWDMVAKGKAPPGFGAIVSNRVPSNQQAHILRQLVDLGVETEAQAHRAIAELTKPKPDRAEEVLDAPQNAPRQSVDGLVDPVDGPGSKGAKAQTDRLEDNLTPAIEAARIAGAGPARVPETMAEASVTRMDVIQSIADAVALRNAQDLVDRILPKGSTRIEVVDGPLIVDGVELEAMATKGVIQIARSALRKTERVGHEAVHILRNLDIINDSEIRLLAEAGRRVGVFGKDREATYRDAYAKRFADPEAPDAAQKLQAMLDEEAAAHAIEYAMAGGRLNGAQKGIAQKVIDFLRRVAVELGAKGFRNADEFAQAFLMGELAKRQARRAWFKENGITALVRRGEDKRYAIIGPRAQTFDWKRLNKAMEMERAGASREDIWHNTKTWRWLDGKWRQEVSDAGIEVPDFNPISKLKTFGFDSPLLRHPEIARAYPHSAKLPITIHRTNPFGYGEAVFRRPDWDDTQPKAPKYFTPKRIRQLTRDADFWADVSSIELMPGQPGDLSVGSTRSLLAHETDHFVQANEGFAEGSNPNREMAAFSDLDRSRLMLPIIIRETLEQLSLSSLADITPDRMPLILEGIQRAGQRLVGDGFVFDIPRNLNEMISASMLQNREDLIADVDMATEALAFQRYEASLGEASARLAEKRSQQTKAHLDRTPPWEDLDIPERDIIVRRGLLQNIMPDDPDRRFAIKDKEIGQTMKVEADALGYYSRALEAAMGWKQNKGTPDQVRALMTNPQNVKPAEISTFDLDGFLEGKTSVTKDELVRFIKDNQTQLKEVVYQRTNTDDLYEEHGVILDRLANNLFSRDFNELNIDQTQRLLRIVDQDYEHIDIEQSSGARFAKHSFDSANPTYKEVVLHLPESTDNLRERRMAELDRIVAEYGHLHNAPEAERIAFEELSDQHYQQRPDRIDFQSHHFPEPNIVGHLMISVVRDANGRLFLLIDQIQSDWGQEIKKKGVRDEAKIADLRGLLSKAQEEFDAGMVNAPKGDPLAQVPFGYDRPVPDSLREVHDQVLLLRNALERAEGAPISHPLVRSTDQWVNTTLRRAIRIASEIDADAIAIPSGDTVLSYNPGKEEGMRAFYDGIVPKNLRKLLQKVDKSSPSPERVETFLKYDGTEAGKGFQVFGLTDDVRTTAKERGFEMFAIAEQDEWQASWWDRLSEDAEARAIKGWDDDDLGGSINRTIAKNRRMEKGYSEIEADRLTEAVTSFEQKLVDQGLDPVDVADGIEAHFGFPVDRKAYAEGVAWWRSKTLKKVDEIETEGRDAPSRSVGFDLTPEDRARIQSDARMGLSVLDIARAMTEERKSYVSVGAVSQVVEAAGIGRAVMLSQIERLYTDPMLAGLSAKDAAIALSRRLNRAVTAKAVARGRERAMAKGNYEGIGKGNAAGSRANLDRTGKGKTWTPEVRAAMATEEFARLDATGAAAKIQERFGIKVTPKAVRVFRSREGLSRRDPDQTMFAIRDDREGNVNEALGNIRAGEDQAGGAGQAQRSAEAQAGVSRAEDPDVGGLVSSDRSGADAVAGRQPTRRRVDLPLDDYYATRIDGPRKTIQGEAQAFWYVHKEGRTVPSEKASDRAALKMMDGVPNWSARVHMIERSPGRWEVASLKVRKNERRQGIAQNLYDAIERDMNITLQPSGRLLEDGYRFWQSRNPEALKYHVKFGDAYVTPKQLIVLKAVHNKLAENTDNLAEIRAALEENARIDDLLAKVPREVFEEDTFDAMFAIRDQSPDQTSVSPRRQLAEALERASDEAYIQGLQEQVDVGDTAPLGPMSADDISQIVSDPETLQGRLSEMILAGATRYGQPLDRTRVEAYVADATQILTQAQDNPLQAVQDMNALVQRAVQEIAETSQQPATPIGDATPTPLQSDLSFIDRLGELTQIAEACRA
jgi:hypothetical protein